MIRCVLFDIDNTLLFKTPSIAENVFTVLQPQQPALGYEEVEKAYAQSEIWQGEQIRREHESGVRMDDEEYLQNVFKVYEQALGLTGESYKLLRPILMGDYAMDYIIAPDTKETLTKLKSGGTRLGIVSNNHSHIRNALCEHGLSAFFDCIVISEEVGLYKPDPQILELACKQVGVLPAESLYVGDHPFDVLCAHAANMPAVWMPVNRFMCIPEYICMPEYKIARLGDMIEVLS